METHQLVLVLYRKLLAISRGQKAESELIPVVVNCISEILPDFRISFANIGRDGKFEIVYAKSPPGLPTIPPGTVFDMSGLPEVVQSLLELKRFQSDDVRTLSGVAGTMDRAKKYEPTLSRIDIPFERDQGSVSLLSVGARDAGPWNPEIVNLITEIGSLVTVLFRDLRSQIKLKETETIFRQFAENVGVVFWMSDTSKNEMVYVSPAFEEIWGRTTDSLYASPKSFLDAIHPEDRPRVEQGMKDQHLGLYEMEYRVLKPDGQVRWVKDRAFPVKNAQNEVYRIAGIAEDITPLREARERLEASRNQMAANAKFAALGEMASGIAHEINNPLAVIHGLAVQMRELVTQEGKACPEREVVESYKSIERMANRIAGIVKGLRTFSRQTAADPMSPIDLNSVLEETLAMCAPRLKEAEVTAEVNWPNKKLMVPCRSSEISQVILNLLGNAVDAVAEGPARKIWVILNDPEPGTARLAVEDAGPGIPAELHDKIFQPFFTTKEVGKGTGLGLSISKSIVEAHGGKLFLDQTSPKTRFVVELPSE